MPPQADFLRAPHLRSALQSLTGTAEVHNNLEVVGPLLRPGQPRRIIICADGTWNTPAKDSGGNAGPTNVWLTYQLVNDVGDDDMPQLKYYHAGVGMIRNSGILTRGSLTEKELRKRIRDAYKLYRDRSSDSSPVAPGSVEFRRRFSYDDFRLAGIGVWDTVGALAFRRNGTRSSATGIARSTHFTT